MPSRISNKTTSPTIYLYHILTAVNQRETETVEDNREKGNKEKQREDYSRQQDNGINFFKVQKENIKNVSLEHYSQQKELSEMKNKWTFSDKQSGENALLTDVFTHKKNVKRL
jgi:hypothetical protein